MFIADLHIHSRYSRATSRECIPEILELWARRKGIDVLGTGDFTHPAWRKELREKLVPFTDGLYRLKDDLYREAGVAGGDTRPQFIISGEISSIYKKNGRVRKVHNLVLLPGLEQAETIARQLETIGNLHSDGRPILGLDSRDLLEIILERCPEAIFIPAHIWTPHFSLFGAYSGFDTIEECFDDLTDYIYALETGLSSDPPMNWRLSALDKFLLVSNSDAHSPANLGREANIFATEISYPAMLQALKNRQSGGFYGTLEFFPAEGKYHYDGHRACKLCCPPAETKSTQGRCPVCGGRITAGVLHRVEELADRQEGFVPTTARHFESLVPLQEVIAASLGYSPGSIKARRKYDSLLQSLGPELFILRSAPLSAIAAEAGPCVAEGVRRLRCGQVKIKPGFDGEYGKIEILDKSEIDTLSGQISFFAEEKPVVKASSIHQTSLVAAEEVPAHAHVQPVAQAAPPGLNPEQGEAVACSGPVIAVIAGPGTGKTNTLVHRIAYLVEAAGVSPASITAVTFTNQAAREMRLRLKKQLGEKRSALMNIGTFHSLCLQMLTSLNGPGSPAIIDEYSAAAIVSEIAGDLQLKLPLRDTLRSISLQKNGVLPDLQQLPGLPDSVYEQYCTRLERYGVMDYDDILLNAYKAVTALNSGAATDWAQAFRHLLVDEFQDINDLQYQLVKEWGKHSESIFIIGDPNQSVYGFRGSNPRCFDRFHEDFSDVRLIHLTRNYRSTPEITDCAGAVIAQHGGNPGTLLKAVKAGGAKVRLVETDNELSAAGFIVREINRLVGGIDMLEAHALPARRPKTGSCKGFSDIAILYRTNRQAHSLEQALAKEGIQYKVAGRDSFLADEPVREVLAFFRFLLNPRDIVSLRLCLKTDSSWPADLKSRLLEMYLASEKSATAFAAIAKSLLPAALPVNFPEMLEKYQPLVRQHPPVQLLDSWIQDNALTGVKCLDLLLHTAVLHHDMPSLLHTLTLGREGDVVRSGSKTYSSDAVSLMTLHGAKGLEFPVVFLCGVNDGLIPLKHSGRDFDREEEKRLFYVGMTRAQEELILLSSHTPSPFLATIPANLLTKENRSCQKQQQRFEQAGLF